MRLEPVVQLHQLAVDLRHFLFHVGDRLGCADARDHVLALGVGQIFAVDHVLAGAGIAGKAHAGTGIAAHVAEHHGAHVDRGAVGLILGDLELLAVVHRALAHPGTKYRADRNFKLLVGVLRKRLAGMPFDDFEKLAREFFQVLGGKIQVEARVVFAFERGHPGVEMLIVDAQRDLAEQLDETAVGIIGKARVGGQLDQPLQGRFVEPEIEYGIHHPRHGHRRTGTHRNQQRILGVAETLAGLLLQRRHMALEFLHQAIRQLVGFEVGKAGVRRDRETGRNVQADLRHFAQAGTLAAQQDLVLAVALFECVDIFFGGHDDASRN